MNGIDRLLESFAHALDVFVGWFAGQYAPLELLLVAIVSSHFMKKLPVFKPQPQAGTISGVVMYLETFLLPVLMAILVHALIFVRLPHASGRYYVTEDPDLMLVCLIAATVLSGIAYVQAKDRE